MLHQFTYPTGNQIGPEAMAGVLRSVHAANRERHSVELILADREGSIQFFIECPVELRAILLVHLLDAFPGAKLERCTDSLLQRHRPNLFQCILLRPQLPFEYLRRQFDRHDPMTAVLSLLKNSGATRSHARITVRLWPARESRCRAAERSFRLHHGRCYSKAVQQSFVRGVVHESRIVRLMSRLLAPVFVRKSMRSPEPGDKLTDCLFETQVCVEVQSDETNVAVASEKLTDIAGAFALFASNENQFTVAAAGSVRPVGHAGLLTPNEIALMWHPVKAEVQVSKLQRIESVEVEPPIELPIQGRHARLTPLGRTAYRKDKRLVGLPIESLRRHVYVTGKTGVGKSSLMLSMMTTNMRDNLGIALIDPHGDLYLDVLCQTPKRRTNELILFDPGSDQELVPFNPLDTSSGIDRGRVADGVLSAFVKVFGLDTATAPRLLHIFRSALYTLVEQPDATLIGINRLLTDTAYRKAAVARVSNPAVREFWHGEFGRWHERDRAQFLASLQNKLGAFLSNRQLQLILGQPKSGFNLRRVMDEGGILLCNLSKGRLGEDSANLLGALLLSSLQLAGESRADIPESERRDFVCYVDELQNYSTTALATSLSEARKYRAPLFVLANQYREQLAPELRSAIIGNCGSVVTFQVGSEDAPFWSRHFGGAVTPESLMAMPKYHAVANILIDGMPSGPMTIKTMPPPIGIGAKVEKLKRQSLRQFARPRVELEQHTDALFG
ncbi:hypothetical protein RMSM_06618 [Rhodopirellula maiorica SM1]|uniref:Helicase HerA central domain-containing protein n=1 Tax=Rhodopirellula maiorica SM1 TaxID=1265738 RepID=M5RAQ9_9BACT|nr:DUF87 domain-containing protein [Rhodopirellula maiorica]EMI16460.1 hypothetical protein RMSM_06618 [Rhodopirellula maiorica SM1]